MHFVSITADGFHVRRNNMRSCKDCLNCVNLVRKCDPLYGYDDLYCRESKSPLSYGYASDKSLTCESFKKGEVT